jgi:hypothetical protein
MHRLSASFILGYHGCHRPVGERLLSGANFQPSDNAYDWLGPGTYFWEANPRRGLEFMREKAKRRGFNLRDAFVVGAVIDLGLCLDLTTSTGIELLKKTYEEFVRATTRAGHALPHNSEDLLRRPLDCAVIKFLYEILESQGASRVQSVRGVFTEGPPAYDGAGFCERTHIQIAVVDPKCIKGIFRVPRHHLN